MYMNFEQGLFNSARTDTKMQITSGYCSGMLVYTQDGKREKFLLMNLSIHLFIQQIIAEQESVLSDHRISNTMTFLSKYLQFRTSVKKGKQVKVLEDKMATSQVKRDLWERGDHIQKETYTYVYVYIWRCERFLNRISKYINIGKRSQGKERQLQGSMQTWVKRSHSFN